MRFRIHKLIIGMAAVAICCAGCGGGGGGGGAPVDPIVNPPSTTLGLSVQPPDVTGKAGQQLVIPIAITGTGSVTTASTDISVSDATFEPVASNSSTAQAIAGLPDTAAASYKWIDSQTIRVLFVAASGVASGTTLVNVPVKVKSEAASTPVLRNTRINR